jgi:arsenate reductase
MADRTENVLFLCTGNHARSILAEALLDTLGEGRYRGCSAGSHPKGSVHPLALELLARNGLPTEGLRSKSWDEYARPGAPAMRFVFTVCDAAAAEFCPVWPGTPVTAHWGVPDPALAAGSDEEKRAAFAATCDRLRARIVRFLNLPVDKLEPAALERRLREIGEIP